MINNPPQSQAHLRVRQADTQPKPAKELAFLSHKHKKNMQQK